MRSSIANVVLRGRTFHFRRSVPESLRHKLQRNELCCSLRTADRRLAQVRARRLYLLSDEVFERLNAEPMLTDQQISQMVQDFYGHILALENDGRLRTGRLPEEVRQRKAKKFSELAASFRSDLGANNFERTLRSTETLIRKHGVEDSVSREDRLRLSQALLRGWIEVASAIQARYEGDFNYKPSDALLAVQLETVFGATSPDRPTSLQAPGVAGPATQGSIAPAPPAGALFSDLAKAFVSKQRSLKRWENQTAAQNAKSYELFADICRDRELKAYERRDAAKFKDILERLPADYGKASRYRGKVVEEILRLDEAHGSRTPRLSVRTVKRHLSALSAMWDEHIPLELASQNIFQGFKFRQHKRAQDQRPMWSRADLQKLFATPVWTGCKSKDRRAAPGALIIRDEKFWLPLIAVFSAARQEEICQLHVADVRLEEGVWVLDINGKPPRRLKNRSAARLVPLHDKLIDLGFLTYVDERRAAGEPRVFPNLQGGGADGRLGHGFTKWFTRYRREAGVYEPGKDFHALRHSATTFLHQGGVADSIVDRLTGHTTPGETARYTKSSSIIQLKSAIETLDPGLDLTTGRKDIANPGA